MDYVKDLKWKPGMKVVELVDALGSVGFQSTEIEKAKENIIQMKKNGAKIYLTFTSNMVTSGLRGFFAQVINLGLVDFVVTTIGGIEEDIMKAHGENFIVGDFQSNDVELHEKGVNRVGNLFIKGESYAKFEDLMTPLIKDLYAKKKRWTPSEIFYEIGSTLKDEDSILYQAHKKNIPIYCPAITDGAFGFHLFMFQQFHDDFIVDVVKDFQNIVLSTNQDDKKGLISLGGSISKHHAIFACLLNGGLDYAVYMTTASHTSGSMSGATTNEAKSWGKIKDDSDAVTVKGDVSINFPLVMIAVFEELNKEGLLE